MAELWKGAPVAAALTERLCGQAERLRARGISPTLAIVRVGERAEDLSYERGACKRCEMIGISVKHFILPVNCTQEELLTVIRRINEDGAIHGCLLFRPLPRHLDEAAVCAALSPVKDVDGITSGSLASVFFGDGQGYPPAPLRPAWNCWTTMVLSLPAGAPWWWGAVWSSEGRQLCCC